MTQIDPWRITADGLSFGTFAHSIEQVQGVESVAARRYKGQRSYARHGDIPTFRSYYEAKTFPLMITLGPWDPDGDIDHPTGYFGHLRKNWESLATVIGKRHGFIDLRRFVPDDAGESVELQADAVVGRTVPVRGSVAVWRVLVEFILPYPFWHELPKVEREAAMSHSFTTGGTAPINDMVFTFAGDGTLSWGDVDITVAGSTSAVTVDVGQRKVFQSGQLAMDLIRLSKAMDNWMEWPPQTAITLSSDVNVAVDYYNARH